MMHYQTKLERLEFAMRLFLWPGEHFCNWLNIRDPDSRLLLRMFVNLTIYGKVALSLVFFNSALS